MKDFWKRQLEERRKVAAHWFIGAYHSIDSLGNVSRGITRVGFIKDRAFSKQGTDSLRPACEFLNDFVPVAWYNTKLVECDACLDIAEKLNADKKLVNRHAELFPDYWTGDNTEDDE